MTTIMTTTDRNAAETFEVLHALKVKGLATDDFLTVMTGLDGDRRIALVAGMVDDGWVRRRETPRLSGTMITPAGRAEYDRLAAQLAPAAPDVEAIACVYDAFLPVNSDFKKVCAAWQMAADGTPNDHTDVAYDAKVVGDLVEIQGRLGVVLAPAGDTVPRFGRYRGRLAAALAKVQAGNTAAFARPMYDSYHDIWMELHQDLLLTAGRARNSADEG